MSDKMKKIIKDRVHEINRSQRRTGSGREPTRIQRLRRMAVDGNLHVKVNSSEKLDSSNKRHVATASGNWRRASRRSTALLSLAFSPPPHEPDIKEYVPPLERWQRSLRRLRTVIRIALSLKSYAPTAKGILAGLKLTSSLINRNDPDQGDSLLKPHNLFDKEYFKPNKEFRMPQRAIDVCMKPPELRTEEDINILAPLMRTLSSLRMFDSRRIRTLSRLFTYQRFGTGRVIIRKGHPGHALYVIFSGRAAVSFDDNPEPVQLREQAKTHSGMRLIRGEIFGEVALVKPQATRTATICSTDDIELIVLDKDDFHKQELFSHWQLEREDKISFLRSVNVFKEWDPEDLRAISDRCRTMNKGYGKVIVEDGANADSLWFVVKGRCRIYKKLNKKDCPAEHLDLFEQPQSLLDIEWNGAPPHRMNMLQRKKEVELFKENWRLYCLQKLREEERKREHKPFTELKLLAYQQQAELYDSEDEEELLVTKYTTRLTNRPHTAAPRIQAVDQYMYTHGIAEREESVNEDAPSSRVRVKSAYTRSASNRLSTSQRRRPPPPPPGTRSYPCPASLQSSETSGLNKTISAFSLNASEVEPSSVDHLFVMVDELSKTECFGSRWLTKMELAKGLIFVSQGADVIKVPLKEFLAIHGRNPVQFNEDHRGNDPYPDDEELFELAKHQMIWNSYRHSALSTVPRLADVNSLLKPINLHYE